MPIDLILEDAFAFLPPVVHSVHFRSKPLLDFFELVAEFPNFADVPVHFVEGVDVGGSGVVDIARLGVCVLRVWRLLYRGGKGDRRSKIVGVHQDADRVVVGFE
jgi:hypothetical protein